MACQLWSGVVHGVTTLVNDVTIVDSVWTSVYGDWGVPGVAWVRCIIFAVAVYRFSLVGAGWG